MISNTHIPDDLLARYVAGETTEHESASSEGMVGAIGQPCAGIGAVSANLGKYRPT
jgi:hypothetical protein